MARAKPKGKVGAHSGEVVDYGLLMTSVKVVPGHAMEGQRGLGERRDLATILGDDDG
jgi:hypothetical protein